MLLDVNRLHVMEVLPGNRKMHLLRRDVRLNDVNWSLVTTSLLGNSGYQNDRKIYDQSKMTLRLAISWEQRVKQIPTDLLTYLTSARFSMNYSRQYTLSLCHQQL